MRPGHELDLKLIAVKGIGQDHAKFSPVGTLTTIQSQLLPAYLPLLTATAFYRLLPDIKLIKEVEGEAADRLQACFSPGVIGVRKTKSGKRVAFVNDARYDASSRNVYRYDDLKDCVIISKVQDHFICK